MMSGVCGELEVGWVDRRSCENGGVHGEDGPKSGENMENNKVANINEYGRNKRSNGENVQKNVENMQKNVENMKKIVENMKKYGVNDEKIPNASCENALKRSGYGKKPHPHFAHPPTAEALPLSEKCANIIRAEFDHLSTLILEKVALVQEREDALYWMARIERKIIMSYQSLVRKLLVETGAAKNEQNNDGAKVAEILNQQLISSFALFICKNTRWTSRVASALHTLRSKEKNEAKTNQQEKTEKNQKSQKNEKIVKSRKNIEKSQKKIEKSQRNIEKSQKNVEKTEKNIEKTQKNIEKSEKNVKLSAEFWGALTHVQVYVFLCCPTDETSAVCGPLLLATSKLMPLLEDLLSILIAVPHPDYFALSLLLRLMTSFLPWLGFFPEEKYEKNPKNDKKKKTDEIRNNEVEEIAKNVDKNEEFESDEQRMDEKRIGGNDEITNLTEHLSIHEAAAYTARKQFLNLVQKYTIPLALLCCEELITYLKWAEKKKPAPQSCSLSGVNPQDVCAYIVMLFLSMADFVASPFLLRKEFERNAEQRFEARKVEKEGEELNKKGESVQKSDKNVEKMETNVAKMEKDVKKIDKNGEKMDENMKKMEVNVEQMEKKVEKIEKNFDKSLYEKNRSVLVVLSEVVKKIFHSEILLCFEYAQIASITSPVLFILINTVSLPSNLLDYFCPPAKTDPPSKVNSNTMILNDEIIRDLIENKLRARTTFWSNFGEVCSVLSRGFLAPVENNPFFDDEGYILYMYGADTSRAFSTCFVKYLSAQLFASSSLGGFAPSCPFYGGYDAGMPEYDELYSPTYGDPKKNRAKNEKNHKKYQKNHTNQPLIQRIISTPETAIWLALADTCAKQNLINLPHVQDINRFLVHSLRYYMQIEFNLKLTCETTSSPSENNNFRTEKLAQKNQDRKNQDKKREKNEDKNEENEEKSGENEEKNGKKNEENEKVGIRIFCANCLVPLQQEGGPEEQPLLPSEFNNLLSQLVGCENVCLHYMPQIPQLRTTHKVDYQKKQVGSSAERCANLKKKNDQKDADPLLQSIVGEAAQGEKNLSPKNNSGRKNSKNNSAQKNSKNISDQKTPKNNTAQKNKKKTPNNDPLSEIYLPQKIGPSVDPAGPCLGYKIYRFFSRLFFTEKYPRQISQYSAPPNLSLAIYLSPLFACTYTPPNSATQNLHATKMKTSKNGQIPESTNCLSVDFPPFSETTLSGDDLGASLRHLGESQEPGSQKQAPNSSKNDEKTVKNNQKSAKNDDESATNDEKSAKNDEKSAENDDKSATNEGAKKQPEFSTQDYDTPKTGETPLLKRGATMEAVANGVEHEAGKSTTGAEKNGNKAKNNEIKSEKTANKPEKNENKSERTETQLGKNENISQKSGKKHIAAGETKNNPNSAIIDNQEQIDENDIYKNIVRIALSNSDVLNEVYSPVTCSDCRITAYCSNACKISHSYIHKAACPNLF